MSRIMKEGKGMKKLFVLFIICAMSFSLVACGTEEESANSNSEISSSVEVDEGKIDASEVVEQALEEAEELDSFSMEAVEHYLKYYGISLSDLEPAWDWELPNDRCAYADNPANGGGHAVVIFKYTGGELTDEEINDYFASVFRATADASDDGYNIIGYEFAGDGEDALAETTFEDAMDSWMPGWAFRKDGKCMVVYVSSQYDNDKESELDRLFYYYGVKFDLGVGLQKSFDDTWEDAEEAFEEYEDEIKDALEDYAN